MQIVLVDSIHVLSNRQRQDLDDEKLSDLAASIRTNGLLHPPIVRYARKDEDFGNGMLATGVELILVAGERRLLAIESMLAPYRYGTYTIPEGKIPINFLGELTPEQAMEAELEENIRRVDLTWQERAKAVASLHALRLATGAASSFKEVGEEAFPNFNPDAAGHAVRQAVMVNKALQNDPDVAKAKDLNDAWKVIKRKEQARVNSIIAAEVGTKSATELHSVYQADCREWLRDCDGGRFDCILIDPPYGMGADTFGDAAGKLVGIEHGYEDSADYAMELQSSIAMDLFRVAKEEAHLYIWCDIDNFGQLKEITQNAGWWTFRTPLINVKREGGRVPWPENGPRRCYEICLYAVKGKRPTTGIYRDVFESTLESDTGGHGAAKPIEAYTELLKRSCKPGDTVLDCFAGTGTILAAAHELRLRATAVERDPSYYGQCVARLRGLDTKRDVQTVDA